MTENENIIVDPWLKSPDSVKSLPPDAVFACAYNIDVNPFTIFEAAFFRRTKTQDELWIAMQYKERFAKEFLLEKAPYQEFLRKASDNIGRACAMPVKGETSSACLTLLENLISARVGGGWPDTFISAGMITETDYKGLVARIEKELEENVAKARSIESEIIKTAKELGLNPEPTGTGPHHWQANCPGTNHQMLISSESNTFGCGYCRRKGGVGEMREFVK